MNKYCFVLWEFEPCGRTMYVDENGSVYNQNGIDLTGRKDDIKSNIKELLDEYKLATENLEEALRRMDK